MLKHLALIMVVLALALRFWFSYAAAELEAKPADDEVIFTGIAWNLVVGNGYSITGELPTARRPPGYPLLLAGIFALFGQSWVAGRLANIVLGFLTIGLTYLIGAKLFNGPIGLMAVLLIGLFYNSFVEYPLEMVSDTLFVFLVSLMLFILVKICEYPNSRRLKLLAGTLLGLAILTRSELVLLIPFLFIWAVLVYHPRFSAALRTFILILLPVVLLVLPWLIRNYLVFNEIIVATNVGRVMWGVYNPDTFTDLDHMGGWHPLPLKIRNAGDYPRHEWDPDYQYLPEPEWNRQLTNMAVTALQENIHLLPQMEVYKLYRLMYKSGATETQNLLRLPLIYCFFFGLFLLLAGGDKRFLIFYMLLLYAVSSALIFYPSARFRLVIDPTVALMACYGLTEQIKLVVITHRARLKSLLRG